MGVRRFLSTLSQTTSVSHSLCCRQLINLLLSRLGIRKLISPYINTAILQKSINNEQQPTLLMHFQAPLLFSIYLPVLVDPFSTALLQQGPGKAIISAGERRWLLWHSRSDIIIVTALSGLPNLQILSSSKEQVMLTTAQSGATGPSYNRTRSKQLCEERSEQSRDQWL